MTNLPRGLRNNNPGNIDKGQSWQGLDEVQSDSRFASFISMDYGCRALIKLLQTYHNKYGLNCVEDIINRWAPPTENDTTAYVNSVAKALNVSPTESLTFNRNTLITLGKAIARHENGAIADEVIDDATWESAADLAGL